MTHLIHTLDLQATNFIYQIIPHNQFFNLIFYFFSAKSISILIWVVIFFFLIIFEEQRNHRFILVFLSATIFTLLFVKIGIKPLIHRTRPSFGPTCNKGFSFPSGHASASFAAATVLAFFDKKRRKYYYFIAGLIAFSRIYLHCHYILDVVGGGLLGYIISKTTIIINQKISAKNTQN